MKGTNGMHLKKTYNFMNELIRSSKSAFFNESSVNSSSVQYTNAYYSCLTFNQHKS